MKYRLRPARFTNTNIHQSIRHMKRILFSVIIFGSLLNFGHAGLKAQDLSEQASAYFMQYLSLRSITDLGFNSLPTAEDCKLVFAGPNAYTYSGYVQEIINKKGQGAKEKDQSFADLRIKAFSTQDILLEKCNYPAGMKDIVNKLQAYVVFYEVELLKTSGDESGVSVQYWVNINGRWIFFPKILSVFTS
jgi:hypothetical protein